MKINRLALLTIFSFLLIVGCGAHSPKAQWISHPNFKHEANQWYQIRKEVTISKSPKELITKIAADSKYWLYINGELAIFEGQLKRGPNHKDTYFDEVDLAPFMREGKNTIAVLMWYYGREGFSHKDSKKAGFFLDNEKFSTDSTWHIKRSKAYKSTGNPQGNFRLPESNIRFDAREYNKSWIEQDYDDSKWYQAQNSGLEGASPWNKLVKRPIPLFKTKALTKIDDFKREGNRIVVKLPYDMQYHAYIKVKSSEGKYIKINPGNLRTLNDVPLRGEYITKEGEQEYIHLPWLSGHEIHFIVEEGIDVIEVGYMESGYDTQFDGTFKVADEYLMKYFKKAQRTLYVNMRDTYFDCPDRERAQWIGDGIILSEESFYLLDSKALALSKKMYNELFDWQRADHTLFGPIPAGNWDKELPQQILAAVGQFGIGNYYKYTGDRQMLKKAYPHIKDYLSLWKVEDNGAVPFRKGGWTWGDWGTQIDRNLSEHIWYYIALDNLAYMAEELGKHEEALKIKNNMDKIKQRVNHDYWTKNGYRSTTYKDEIDDRGNALAVISGIADKEKYSVIINLFKNVEHASPYMEKYVMEALFKMDEGKFAIERFKKRYAKMVNHPTCTTLWELWDYTASVNHAWSGGPLSVLYKNMAGIRPIKPGFEEFCVYPDLIGLDSLSCSFTTVKGKISLDIKTKGKRTLLKLKVPNQSAAILRVPVSSENVIFSNESQVKKENKGSKYNYYSVSSGEITVEY
ncbi:hypothetical protein K4L44_15620 [Halosquirtibacter laminarini]|uniref:Uncharacterized protein n=1 Tax=Halosquirtibacter laminarini TaxID=3374600 RepID=A0AC61NMP7_9BACT|nr:hypothetical protein K4L44_15620 [Prolixibacteraceae bacterium]